MLLDLRFDTAKILNVVLIPTLPALDAAIFCPVLSKSHGKPDIEGNPHDTNNMVCLKKRPGRIPARSNWRGE